MRVFHSARAWTQNRQRRALCAAALAVFIWAGPAFSAAPLETSSTDAVPGRGVAHEITFIQTKPGREGLELAARLEDGGGLIGLPVSWTVSTLEGERVIDEEAPLVAALLPPGDYKVAIRYGTADFAQTVSIPEAVRLGVTFTLDIGGIRVLPRVGGAAVAAKSETRIFALSGTSSGRLVASSALPGEVVRVRAGAYRVESRFIPGNVVATTDVEVAPGLMKAVEFDHRAGIARLAAPARGKVVWTITASDGTALPPIEGAALEVTLRPGHYEATAAHGDARYSTAFIISAGEVTDVAARK